MPIDKLKNKFFIGSWINDVKQYFTKINEIIDNINDNPARPYTTYTALLTQEATDAPTNIVLENTTGATGVWSYVGVGEYLLTFSDSILDASKCFILVGWGNGSVDTAICYVDGPSTIRLSIYQDGIKTNEELFKTAFELRIYP